MLAARTHVPVERLAHTRLVKVVAVRVNAEEADEREQLRHAVLERRARERPPRLRVQRENSLGSGARLVFDGVGFIKNYAVPRDCVQRRLVARRDLLQQVLVALPASVSAFLY